MISFSEGLKRFGILVDARSRETFVRTVTEVTRSVVEGSEITGAPGQPVDEGTLRASWQTRFLSPTEAEVITKLGYAPHVEDNLRGVTFKNHGPHSIRLTIAGFDRIVSHVTSAVRGNA